MKTKSAKAMIRIAGFIFAAAGGGAGFAGLPAEAPEKAAPPAPPEAPASPTYNKDVAPIFQRACQSCHHPGTVAPMSLMTYDEARPWAKSIREVVGKGTMPPWHADAAVGHFKNDRRLSSAEIETVLQWAAAGAPAGNPADHPEPLIFVEGWLLGEPDLILPLPEHEVKAEVDDEFVTFNVPTGFTEDKWIQAVEFKPGNPAVVHHIVTTTLGTFAPGRQPSAFDPGYGLLMSAGETIRVQMHYHKEKGVAATDQTKIGLRFAREPIHKQVRLEGAFAGGLNIPPGEANYPSSARYKFARDSHLLAMKPHMHMRGKDMTYTVVFPDGREQTLLNVPNYDYDWQTNYELAEPLAVPKGTLLKVEAHFDNSAANPRNPDPTATVRHGEKTTDEMMIGWIQYTDDEEDVAAGKVVKTRHWGGGKGDGDKSEE